MTTVTKRIGYEALAFLGYFMAAAGVILPFLYIRDGWSIENGKWAIGCGLMLVLGLLLFVEADRKAQNTPWPGG